MQRKYVSDGFRIVEWLPHFEQAQCRRCGAWLEELPSSSTPVSRGWSFTWACLVCGFRHRDFSSEPIDSFRPDPSVTIEQPGSLPPWTDWRLPPRLVADIRRVADEYAQPARPEDLPDDSVLDHAGRRNEPWGTFRGETDDPCRVRLSLARLRHVPRPIIGATLACMLAERAALSTGAVFDRIRRYGPEMAKIAESRKMDSHLDSVLAVAPVDNQDVQAGIRVGPVIGWGRLSVPNRYEDWLLVHGAHPWFSCRHDGRQRAPIPDGTEPLAEAIELADALLMAFHLYANADSFLELRNDFVRIGKMMERWRWYLEGQSFPEPLASVRVKLPDSYWLRRWNEKDA
jgi:hypothetical protein